MRLGAPVLAGLVLVLTGCGDGEPGRQPVGEAEAIDLCAEYLRDELPGTRFIWRDPIVREAGETLLLVGTGVRGEEKFTLSCLVDLVHAEVVGSMHGTK